MSLDVDTVREVITIVQFFLMGLYVGIAFYKFMTKKYEGRRDKARFLLFLTFVSFFVVNIYNVYHYLTGTVPSEEFGYMMRNWSQVLMFMMIFEVLELKYLYYAPAFIVLYIQQLYPEWIIMSSHIIGTLSMITMIIVGFKYKAGKLIGLGLMGILGFLIVFGLASGNAIIIILAYLINDIYKLLFISDKIDFYKEKNTENIDVSQQPKEEVEVK